MMLTFETSKLEKAFIKRFNNGIGIKSRNQLTGRENIVLIRSVNRLLWDKNNEISMSNQPNMSPISSVNYQGTSSKISGVNLRECNVILAKLMDKYLTSNETCGINGLHVFLEDDTLAYHNVQKRSVVLVANKDVAKKEGAHFKIPGSLINLIHINSQENESKIQFKADTIVKPMTIFVGEYTLHIDICCKISPNNITHRTVGTQTNVDCSQKALSKSDISSIVSKCSIPQHNTLHIDTQAEINQFGVTTPQAYMKEITDELLSEGEFAKRFNPKASKKAFIEKSQSKTNKGDNIGYIFSYDSSDEMRSEESLSIGNVTGNKSENSITTFDSHTGTYKFSEDSIPQYISSCENFDIIKETSIANKDNPFCNYSNQIVSKRSKSEGNQLSNESSERCTRGSKSQHFCLDTPDTIIKQMNSKEATPMKRINEATHSSSSDVSLHKIKRQLRNVVTSLNQLHSFVQLIDDFSQKPSREENKHESSNDDIFIEIKNQCKHVSDNLHAEKELNQNQSINSLCDRCGSFYWVGNPVNHQCDQWHLKHEYCNLESVKPHKNDLNNRRRTHSYSSAEKEDSILSDTIEKECKSESLQSFINITCLDTKTSYKNHSEKDIREITSINIPNISKSTAIIHYNDKYQNCESANTSTSLLHEDKNDNAPTIAKVGNSIKSLLDDIGEINNATVPRTLKGAESTSEELLNIMIEEKAHSKKTFVGNSFDLNKTKQRVSSWSSSFRYSTIRLLRTREPKLNQLSKSLAIHLKKPTQQKSDTSKNRERSQHIANLAKTQFHEKNRPSSSSTTLHIVPSQSITENALCIDKTYKSISNLRRKYSVHSIHNSKKQMTKNKNNFLKNYKHINVDTNSKHTDVLSKMETRTKNKKWIFF